MGRITANVQLKRHHAQIVGLTALVILLAWGSVGHAYSWRRNHHHFKKRPSKYRPAETWESRADGAPPTEPAPADPAPTEPAPTAVSVNHASVITTIFWAGEAASPDNAGISNAVSAWDGQWQEHFGGVDDPEQRNGYLPVGFTPKENVFYVALPYNDITEEGERKPNAPSAPLYSTMKDTPYSWCKNAWVAVHHDGKTAYAQWEDVGPFYADDEEYVFGDSPPANTEGAKAGLDVSPAVRDYLGLEDVDACGWEFVPAELVPEGPWKLIITTDPGFAVMNVVN